MAYEKDEILTSEFDVMNDFDPEIDSIIMSDDDMELAKQAIENQEPDDPIDVSIDYSEDIHEPSFIDRDADQLIGSERDVYYKPFEDEEEVLDILDTDDEIDDLDDEDDEPDEDDILEEI